MTLTGLAGLALALAQVAAAPDLAPGMLVPSKPGAVVEGWTVDNTGMDNNNEFYVVLRKGGAYRLGWIDPLGNVAQGTVDQVELLAVRPAARWKGEVAILGPNCPKGDDQPIMAFFNARAGMARGYFIENQAIVMKRWKTTRAICQEVGG